MISILDRETRSNVTAEIGFVYGKYGIEKPIFALQTDPAFTPNVDDCRVVSYIKQSGGALFTGHTAMQDWEKCLKEWADNWKKTHSVQTSGRVLCSDANAMRDWGQKVGKWATSIDGNDGIQ